MDKVDNNIMRAVELFKMMEHNYDSYLMWFDDKITRNPWLEKGTDYLIVEPIEHNSDDIMDIAELDCVLTEDAIRLILTTTPNALNLKIHKYLVKKSNEHQLDRVEAALNANEDNKYNTDVIQDLQSILAKTWAINAGLVKAYSENDMAMLRHKKSVKTFMKENWLSYKDGALVKKNNDMIVDYCRRVGIHATSTPRVEDGVDRYPVFVLKAILVDLANIK